MKVYAGSDVRNVAIVGHAHSGKTELITAILKTAKSPAASSRENGGAVTQYDEDEIARKMTMANAVASAIEWVTRMGSTSNEPTRTRSRGAASRSTA